MLFYPAAYAHNSFTFNDHLNADGSRNSVTMLNTYVMDEIQENPVFRDLRDPLHLTQGGQLGRVHKGMRVIQVSGHTVVPDATQRASLSDRARAFRAAFDPSICYRDSPTTDGAFALTFSEATTDTTNWPSGLIPMQYWVRPVQQPFLAERVDDRGWRSWRVALLAADPRSYSQAQQTLSLTTGTTSGNAVNRGNTASPLQVTVTMNGAGSSSFTITRSSVACVFDLSGFANNDVLVVLMEKSAPFGVRGRYVTKNGTENAPLKTSGPSTWLDVPSGTTSFAITNTTNVRTCVLAWYHSWA